MNIILTAAAGLFLILFFTNMKAAARLLCRIVCGFLMLFLLNFIAAYFKLDSVGINILTAIIAGTLELPGCLLLLSVLCFL